MYVYFNYQLSMKDFAVGIKFQEWKLTHFFSWPSKFQKWQGNHVSYSFYALPLNTFMRDYGGNNSKNIDWWLFLKNELCLFLTGPCLQMHSRQPPHSLSEQQTLTWTVYQNSKLEHRQLNRSGNLNFDGISERKHEYEQLIRTENLNIDSLTANHKIDSLSEHQTLTWTVYQNSKPEHRQLNRSVKLNFDGISERKHEYEQQLIRTESMSIDSFSKQQTITVKAYQSSKPDHRLLCL